MEHSIYRPLLLKKKNNLNFFEFFFFQSLIVTFSFLFCLTIFDKTFALETSWRSSKSIFQNETEKKTKKKRSFFNDFDFFFWKQKILKRVLQWGTAPPLTASSFLTFLVFSSCILILKKMNGFRNENKFFLKKFTRFKKKFKKINNQST